MNVVTEFTDFIQESNLDGSNKAGSYLLALESFDATFKTFENTRIRPARHFQPNERYLAEHRELLVA